MKNKPRDQQIKAAVTDDEKRLTNRLATKLDKTVSDLLRDLVLAEIAKAGISLTD